MANQEIGVELERKVAEHYRNLGFTVIAQPRREDINFDLGTYRPDLLVYKPGGIHYLIEIKGRNTQIPVERYRDIAETVSSQPGWRFLLVLGDDSLPNLSEGRVEKPLTKEQIRLRIGQTSRIVLQDAFEAAFLNLWAVLEALLRNRAEEIHLPLERFATSSLVNHLYSQGEISIQQLDELNALLPIRNSIAHGLQIVSVDEYTRRLIELVTDLRDSWEPQNT